MPWQVHSLVKYADYVDHVRPVVIEEQMLPNRKLQIPGADLARIPADLVSGRQPFKASHDLTVIKVGLFNRPRAKCVLPDIFQILLS